MVLCLSWHIVRVRKQLRALADAAEQRRPVLLEKASSITRRYEIHRLSAAYNDLQEKYYRISQAGEGHIHQIQTTLENLREAVVMINHDNTIKMANTAFLNLIESKGSPLESRIDQFLQGAEFKEYLMRFQDGEEAYRREMEVQIRSGKSIWIEISAAPLPDNNENSESCTLLFIHDITRQKKLENMRTEFVSNASHELRTPVTIIKGFADTLYDDGAAISHEERQRFIEKIKTSSDRLYHLLEDLLLLTRLESDHTQFQQENLSLSSLLNDIIREFSHRLDPASQRMETQFCDQPDTVLADPLQISQVVNNLLENILHHAVGFSLIRITTETSEDGVTCSIIDDGQGIPEKDLPHIFQRFYRVDKGRSRLSGGTGLGLSIVKHIIAQHGGSITADSKQGRGTSISFFLPFPQIRLERSIRDRMTNDLMANGE